MAESLQVQCWWWLCHRGQAWHGRPRMAAWAGRGWCPQQWEVAASPSLLLLSNTAGCLGRDETRPCHSPILYLLCHSVGECCKFLKGYWPKDKKTHTVPVCTLSGLHRHLESLYNLGQRELHSILPLCTHPGLTRSWKVPRAMDKWNSSAPTFSEWNLQ